MTVHSSNQNILEALTACIVCDASDLHAINKEQFRHTHALKDPDVVEILRPYADREFVLNRCGKCGFLQPEGLPKEPRYFEALYDQKWSEEWMLDDFRNTYKDSIFRGILISLEDRLGAERKTLLDVGAHVGKMISIAGERGWKADGLELNDQTRKIAIKMTGRPIHRMMAAELVETGVRYDAITLTDVLEHIPYPVSVLTDLRKLLAPGGWISIKVPSGINQLRKQRIRKALGKVDRAEISTSLAHVNHFSPKALMTALGRAGFVRPTVGVGAPELQPGGGIKGSLDRKMRQLVFRFAQLPLGVYSPLALNLQAFAQKQA